MHNFHYEDVKARYGDRAKLLFTDTDSLCYLITTDDWYDDTREDIPAKYDTSDYPEDHPAGLPRMNNDSVIPSSPNNLFASKKSLSFGMPLL